MKTAKPPFRFSGVAISRTHYTLAEWRAEAERRFGPSELDWRFVCPGCGHEQSPFHFREFKVSHGAKSSDAYFNCIGRYGGMKRKWLAGSGEGPCDYTTGGLFNISPVTVLMPDGSEVRIFDFAKV